MDGSGCDNPRCRRSERFLVRRVGPAGSLGLRTCIESQSLAVTSASASPRGPKSNQVSSASNGRLAGLDRHSLGASGHLRNFNCSAIVRLRSQKNFSQPKKTAKFPLVDLRFLARIQTSTVVRRTEYPSTASRPSLTMSRELRKNKKSRPTAGTIGRRSGCQLRCSDDNVNNYSLPKISQLALPCALSSLLP